RSALVELEGDRILPLTRGDASIGAVAAAEDGTTFFTAKRVGEDGAEADDAQLWALPVRGEARELAARPGGFGALHLAGDHLLAELEVHSQAADETEHARLSATRETAKVTAALHTAFPTRYWDQDLGPTRTVLALAALPEDLAWAEATEPSGTEPAGSATGSADGTTDSSADDGPRSQVLHFRHVEMPPGRLVDWTVDRAGSRALVAMSDSRGDLVAVTDLYLLDLIGAQPPRLLREATAEVEHGPGEFSPDGTRALIGRQQIWTQELSLAASVELLDLADGTSTPVWPELDHWVDPVWLDDTTLIATSDDHGRGSVWIGGVDDPAPRRLVGGPEQDLAFSSASVAGGAVIASTSGIDVAPFPVRIDPATGVVEELPNPAASLASAGTLTEVAATAEDGTDLRAWLRVPEGEGPHPLVVFAHGGPWGSWNAWTYRWNPNPFVAAGYAVLLPDPAISTGYGQAMIDRGQHELGGAPFTDIMAL
ncbi:MAG: prolyl oligopeptidase family serine peptidase, partial [Brachybacterium tyrofermentans]